MKGFKDMRISVKLLISLFILIALMGAVGFFGYRSTVNVAEKLANVFGRRLPGIDYLVEADRDLQQLLVAERSMIFSNVSSEEFKGFVATYNEKLEQSRTRFDKYVELATTPKEKEIIERYNESRGEWEQLSQQVVNGRLEDTSDGRRLAIDLTLGEAMKKFEEMRGYMNELQELTLAYAENENNEALATARLSKLTILLVSLLAAAVGFTVVFSISRGITNSITECVLFAKKIEDGDLTHQIDVGSADEIGQLAVTLNQMSANLRRLVLQIQDAALQVANSSEQLAVSVHQLSEGTQTQASTLEETSAAVEELAASVEQVAGHALSQSASVEESSTSMDHVQKTLDEVSGTLDEVSNIADNSVGKSKQGAVSVSKVVEAINIIAESSEKITGIVNIISEIAGQTNLLALNASIEAARAGEHGRGFAVVADEVSKLADRSATSTKEIGSLIAESGKNVIQGVKLAQESGAFMSEITEGANRSSEMVQKLSAALTLQMQAIGEMSKALRNINEMSQSISAATEEQTNNAKQVSKAIENVNDLTQRAASAAEEMSGSTEELTGMAQKMQELAMRFKVQMDLDGDRNNLALVSTVTEGGRKASKVSREESTAIRLKKESAA